MAVPGSPVTAERPLDRVAEAVGDVLNSSSARRDQRQMGAFALRGSTSPFGTDRLRSALHTSDDEVALTAAAVLLGEGDETGLPMAERALTEMRDMVSQQTRHNLIGGISSGGL